MTLARDEYIFLMILAANLIVSVIYLLAGRACGGEPYGGLVR